MKGLNNHVAKEWRKQEMGERSDDSMLSFRSRRPPGSLCTGAGSGNGGVVT